MKKPVTFKGAEIRLSANLSETVEARKQYNGIFKVCMKKKLSTCNFIPFKNIFQD